MVKQYLETIKEEYLSHKNSLENQIRQYENKKRENEIFIEMLQQSHDPNYDAFSPRTFVSSQQNRIAETLEEQKKIESEITLLRDQLQEYEFRIADITSVIKDADVDMERVVGNSELYKTRLALLRSVETERQRIARELHDSMAQSLTALVHKTELCSKIMESDPVKCKLELYSIGQSLRKIIKDTRGLIYDLRPMSIDDIGFDTTIERTIDQFQMNNGIVCKFRIEGDPYPIDSVIQITLLRVIQEAFHNIEKHAHASQVELVLLYLDEKILLTIVDDGEGFDVSVVENENRTDNSGFGLPMMKERVYLMSGTMTVNSEIGKGTTIVVSIPKNKEGE